MPIGAGKPEANYIIERLIDIAARQTGFDRINLRRRNLIAEFPYRSALGMPIFNSARFFISSTRFFCAEVIANLGRGSATTGGS